jgi:hypothetical protein
MKIRYKVVAELDGSKPGWFAHNRHDPAVAWLATDIRPTPFPAYEKTAFQKN